MKFLTKLGLLVIALSLTVSYAFADAEVLSKTQIERLKKVYTYALEEKKLTGYSFENTILEVFLQESSAGNDAINNDVDEIVAYGGLQVTPPSAKFIIKKRKLRAFYPLLNNDKLLKKLLSENLRFSVKIAYNHLIVYYKVAQQRGMKNPYKQTIGKYYGGWNNTSYYNLVKKRKPTIEKYKKQILVSSL